MSPGFGKSKYGSNKYGEKCMFTVLSNMKFFTARKQIGKCVIFRYYSRKHLQQAYRYVVPHNPMTVAQQANRSKFANAMAAWAVLPDAQKEQYKHRVRDRKMYPKNLFVKEYMLTH